MRWKGRKMFIRRAKKKENAKGRKRQTLHVAVRSRNGNQRAVGKNRRKEKVYRGNHRHHEKCDVGGGESKKEEKNKQLAKTQTQRLSLPPEL